jgi:hypothetical protein
MANAHWVPPFVQPAWRLNSRAVRLLHASLLQAMGVYVEDLLGSNSGFFCG